jgi:hypothetical protein
MTPIRSAKAVHNRCQNTKLCCKVGTHFYRPVANVVSSVYCVTYRVEGKTWLAYMLGGVCYFYFNFFRNNVRWKLHWRVFLFAVELVLERKIPHYNGLFNYRRNDFLDNEDLTNIPNGRYCFWSLDSMRSRGQNCGLDISTNTIIHEANVTHLFILLRKRLVTETRSQICLAVRWEKYFCLN